MSHKSTHARNMGLAALLLTGTIFSVAAHAQSAVFTYNGQGGSHQYGLLNGEHVALYINDRGDLGAPYQISGGQPGGKPPSIVDAQGHPLLGNIGANGQVLPANSSVAYGALFSQNPTVSGTIGDSVRAKSELLGAGSTSIIEGFSVYANDGLQGTNTTRFVRVSDLTVTGFTVSGGTVTGPLSAVSNLSADLQFANGDNGTLGIQQGISFQTGGNIPNNQVRFSSTFTNNSSTTLENFRYARVVDANTAFNSPLARQAFGGNTDPNAFALNSSTGGTNAIGIGVYGNGLPGPPEPGSLLFAADSSLTESTLLQTPFDRVTYYVELLNNDAAVIKQKVGNDLITSNDTVVASTANFRDSAFRNQVASFLNFGGQTNTSLILLSPSMTIGARGSANFTFYYFFGATVNNPVPEPGTVALLLTGGLSGLWLRRRKKR